jgi:hypothetical protein
MLLRGQSAPPTSTRRLVVNRLPAALFCQPKEANFGKIINDARRFFPALLCALIWV